jgi:hypothetical protein
MFTTKLKKNIWKRVRLFMPFGLLHAKQNDIFPVDFTEQEKSNIKKIKQYTMTSNERLVSLSRAIDYIEENNDRRRYC